MCGQRGGGERKTSELVDTQDGCSLALSSWKGRKWILDFHTKMLNLPIRLNVVTPYIDDHMSTMSWLGLGVGQNKK